VHGLPPFAWLAIPTDGAAQPLLLLTGILRAGRKLRNRDPGSPHGTNGFFMSLRGAQRRGNLGQVVRAQRDRVCFVGLAASQ
jgi:hypothetical protein